MRHLSLLAAIGCLALWGILAFVIPWPSGWAHLPLAVGVILVVRAIVEADERRRAGEPQRGNRRP
jgi:hypothetical protein